MSELISPTRPHAMQWLVGRWHEAGMLSLSLSLSLVTLRQVATYMRKSLHHPLHLARHLRSKIHASAECGERLHAY